MALQTPTEAQDRPCRFRVSSHEGDKCYGNDRCNFWEWETIERGKGYCNLTDTHIVKLLQEQDQGQQ